MMPNFGNLQLAVILDCTAAPVVIMMTRSNPAPAPPPPSPATRSASQVLYWIASTSMWKCRAWISRN